jgi:colanic acid biosynthesis glycosyl transferase WcaI
MLTMTHILYLTPYYPPEVGAPQARISEMAQRLVQAGHRVTVLTTRPNYPTGIVPAEYRTGAHDRETIAGVEIIRLWSLHSPNQGFWRRILAQLSFGGLSPWLAGKALKRPDVLIVESPPLFDALGGRALARRFKCPYIFTVADIWPESAVQLGALHNRLFIWLAERLEWTTYQKASAVWAVTAGIRSELLRRGLAPEKIFYLTNGVDTAKFHPIDQATARQTLGWGDRFTLVYAGTHGLAQGLQMVLDAAEALRERSDIRFVLIGDGALKASLVADAQRRQLANVTFIDPLPHAEMPLILSAADACLASMRAIPLFAGSLPTKMFEAMACARPIVLAVAGEARTVLIDKADAAISVPLVMVRPWLWQSSD